LTPQEFGRVLQQLLACEFEAAGFHVVENAVGVPDFTASPPIIAPDCQTIAVEVKTTDRSMVSLTQRDLDGVLAPGQLGVVAVLVFPARHPGWLLVSADDLCARSWKIRHLMMKPKAEVGFDVDEVFHQLMAGLETDVVTSGPGLEAWTRSQRHAFLASHLRLSTE
jgi:Holliday junction resolvase